MTQDLDRSDLHEPSKVQPSSGEPLTESLMRLARGNREDIDGLIQDVEVHANIEGTNVICHCHSLKLDGNGRPKLRHLVRSVVDHVLDYAIPRSEIAEAMDEFRKSGSTYRLTRLHNQARSLFTDLEQSGEGGELLLFVLAEKVLRLPQLICKMSLKTNSRMHFHGADGLHVGFDNSTGKLVLFWGESKIFSDVTAAIRDCLASVAPMLAAKGDEDRDLQLLQRHADLNNPDLETALKRFLDPDSDDFNSVEFRALCLVGFDCDAYPTEANKIDLATVVASISSLLPNWKAQIKRRVNAENLSSFGMHFICVPFPSAEDFRQHLRKELCLDNGKDNSTPECVTMQDTNGESIQVDSAASITEMNSNHGGKPDNGTK